MTMFEMALEDMAKTFGADDGKQLILVTDQAKWHTSPNLKIPDGIHILELPPRSPELQPAERLWNLADEVLANRVK